MRCENAKKNILKNLFIFTGEDVKQVCGIVDATQGQQTFQNMCSMEKAACNANGNFTMLSDGPCPGRLFSYFLAIDYEKFFFVW